VVIHPVWHVCLWVGIFVAACIAFLLTQWFESLWVSVPLTLFIALYVFAGVSVLGNHLSAPAVERRLWERLTAVANRRKILRTPDGRILIGKIYGLPGESVRVQVVVFGEHIWLHSEPLLPKWISLPLAEDLLCDRSAELIGGVLLRICSIE